MCVERIEGRPLSKPLHLSHRLFFFQGVFEGSLLQFLGVGATLLRLEAVCLARKPSRRGGRDQTQFFKETSMQVRRSDPAPFLRVSGTETIPVLAQCLWLKPRHRGLSGLVCDELSDSAAWHPRKIYRSKRHPSGVAGIEDRWVCGSELPEIIHVTP